MATSGKLNSPGLSANDRQAVETLTPASHAALASQAGVCVASKPEDQELDRKRAEQAALETELAERELRVASLRSEMAAFERQYLHHVGQKYAELDDLKAQIAEALARQQPQDKRLQEAAHEARERAGETTCNAGESVEEPAAFQPSAEMKKLYRDVARRIHPDLTSDRDDRVRRQELMARANAAYERGEEAQLGKILAEYESSPEAVQGDGAGAELVRVIRRISQARGRLSEIEAEVQELLRSDLCQLKLRAEEAERGGRNLVGEMKERVNEQIEAAKRRLQEMGGSVR